MPRQQQVEVPQRLVEVVAQQGVQAHQVPVAQRLAVNREAVQQRKQRVAVLLQEQHRAQREI